MAIRILHVFLTMVVFNWLVGAISSGSYAAAAFWVLIGATMSSVHPNYQKE